MRKKEKQVKKLNKKIILVFFIIISIIVSAGIVFTNNKETKEYIAELLTSQASNEEEDDSTFTLYKYAEDETEEVAIEGVKFVITDLYGENVVGTDGNTVGEWDDEVQNYVVTTDSNGKITANLAEGLYKAVEVYTLDKYVLDEDEENRTYYFGIGTSQEAYSEYMVKQIIGTGWNYVESAVVDDEDSIIGVGSISGYEISGYTNGADVNEDGVVEEVSSGLSDGIIVKYDSSGNYLWSSLIGGEKDDELTKITASADGGYIAVGYTSSDTVYYDGSVVTSLSRDNFGTEGKDGLILKINSSGNLEWAVRIGGTLDDEITSVVETSDKNIAIVGRFYSSQLDFYETSSSTVADSIGLTDTTTNKMDGFVALYSSTGEWVWDQRIGGTYDVEAVDIVETKQGLAVAVNGIGSSTYPVYFDTKQTASVACSSTSYTNGIVISYDLDGNYSWNYRFFYEDYYNIEVSSLDVNESGNILVAVEYCDILYGSYNAGTATTIVSTSPTNTVYDATIIELTNTGNYVQLYDEATVAGNYDDYISSVKATSDGGILIGGWYYSDAGTDFDQDGSDDGVSGDYTSDGFVVKLDSSGEVEYSSRIYGDGYDSVTTVTAFEDGTIVAGGTTDSSELYILGSEDEGASSLMTQTGNSEGFIIVKKESAEILETNYISVENTIKTFKITTKIANYETEEDFNGGNITGETDITVDDVSYTTTRKSLCGNSQIWRKFNNTNCYNSI